MKYDATLKRLFRRPPDRLLAYALGFPVAIQQALPTEQIVIGKVHPDLLLETRVAESGAVSEPNRTTTNGVTTTTEQAATHQEDPPVANERYTDLANTNNPKTTTSASANKAVTKAKPSAEIPEPVNTRTKIGRAHV